MLSLLLLSGCVAVVGVVPLLSRKRWKVAAVTAVIFTLVNWFVLYMIQASAANPLWGSFGWTALIELALAAALDGVLEGRPTWTVLLPLMSLMLFGGRACTGCKVFRAHEYASMIGTLEERTWTEDVQPANPKHIRLVPQELAVWLANKQLGSAGSIGSQFQIESFTLQLVKGELWYVAPLDFRGFRAWWSADIAPGYVMVSAEDPERPVEVRKDLKFTYTPNAYFGKNLTRHLQENGYRGKGLMDHSLEIDEDGKPWWVVSVYEPAIAWWGEKILGVAVIDPVTGEIAYHAVGETPEWIDRVYPASTIHQYIAWWGDLSGGWWNSLWGKKNIVEPEETHLVYGVDGHPQWVTPITSNNEKDQSLLGLIYTDVHSGKSVIYRTSGGTDNAILQTVNNRVAYKKQHGASPVVYNVHGMMTSVVHLLGENHTYQGVAIVSIADPQKVAIGSSFEEAMQIYEQELAKSGTSSDIDASSHRQTITAKLLRIGSKTQGENVTYYLYVEGQTHIFAGGSQISYELPITQPDDTVELTFIDSGLTVVTLTNFDNLQIGSSAAPASPPPVEQKP